MSTNAKQGLHVFALALIYFAVFCLSVVFGAGRGLFKFPELGSDFVSQMAVAVGAGLLVAIVVCSLTYLAIRWVESIRSLAKTFSNFFEPLTSLEVFFVSIFSAMGEEFLFRGVVQHYFGWITTGVLFGILHTGPDRRFLPWTFFGVGVGLMLGALYDWSGNLLAPVTAHFIINLINLHMILSFGRKSYGAGSS
jgi:hypothetical protein